MQEKTKVLSQQAAKIGLLINKKKTEIMRNLDNTAPITLDNEILKEVDRFTYLGSVVTINGYYLPDIKNKLSKAAGAMNILNYFWKNKSIQLNTKLRIYRSNMLTVLLYGAETWSMTKGVEIRLASFHQRCLHRLLNIRWNDFITNTEVTERAKIKDIITITKRRR